jgi:hypothetical protein
MKRLFSNIKYKDMCCVVCETCGSAPQVQRISVRLLLVEEHEELGIFDPH